MSGLSIHGAFYKYLIGINQNKHQCDQTWPNSANVADFGVCAAGKIWRWPAWPVGSFVAGSRLANIY